jgi:hypothetical protein
MPSGPDGGHLFVILNDPQAIAGYGNNVCVLTSLCSVTATPYDATVVLQPGTHPFVNRQSYLAYGKTRIEPAAHLVSGVLSGIFVPHHPFASPIFEQIRAGLDTSPRTKNAFKNLGI